jgi:hypothetical protein
MWCSTCQQDIPQLAAASGAELRCGKCGTMLRSSLDDALAGQTPAIEEACHAGQVENGPCEKLPRLPPLPDEDWALEAEVRGVQRLLSALKARVDASAEPVRVHFPELAVSRQAVDGPPPDESREIEEIEEIVASPAGRGHSAAWVILSLGLAVFACGAVLLTWSQLGQREDLWPIGLPLTILGQAGLVLGVVLQLESLMGTARSSAAKEASRVREHRGSRAARRAMA